MKILILLFLVSQHLLAGPLDYFRSYPYRRSTFENYSFNSCQKFNSEERESYYVHCRDQTFSRVSDFEKLTSDLNALGSNELQETFLEEMKDAALVSLDSSLEKLKKLKACISSSSDSPECNQLRFGLELSLKEDLPKVRTLMSMMNMPGHIYSATRPERFQKSKLRHEISGLNIADLTSEEMTFIRDHTNQLEEKFRQEVLRGGEIPEIGDCTVRDGDGFFLRQSDECKRFGPMVAYRVNNLFDKQNRIYKYEYHQLLAVNPMISLITKAPDENRMEDIVSALRKIEIDSEKTLRRIRSLEGKKRIELLAFEDFVDDFLLRSGPSQIHCDLAQELNAGREFGELKQDLLLGGMGLLGAGACAFTWGLGCLTGGVIAMGAEAGLLSVAQLRLSRAESAFFAGVINPESVRERKTNRNLAIILAPLTVVGPEAGIAVREARTVTANLTRRFIDQTPLSRKAIGEEISAASDTAYRAINERLLAKYPQYHSVLADPRAYVLKMEQSFQRQKSLTPDTPYRFDFSELGIPTLGTMERDLVGKISQVTLKRAIETDPKKIAEYDKNLELLKLIQIEIRGYLEKGQVTYESLYLVSHFYSRAVGQFDAEELSFLDRSFLEVDRYFQGHKLGSAEEEFKKYMDRKLVLFDAPSPVPGFRDAEVAFETAFRNSDRLEMIFIPTTDHLDADIFSRLVPYDIYFMGVTTRAVPADGFVRPGGDFWVHDLRHSSAIFHKRALYREKYHVTPRQEEELQRRSDLWRQELNQEIQNIPDREVRSAARLLMFNHHHDRGYPVLPSSYSKETVDQVPFGLYYMLKVSGQPVNFSRAQKNFPEAYEWLRSFWLKRLHEEEAILAAR